MFEHVIGLRDRNVLVCRLIVPEFWLSALCTARLLRSGID